MRDDRARRTARLTFAGVVSLVIASAAPAATLAEKAKESGCSGRATLFEGSTYKCQTASGAWAYFNVPDLAAPPAATPPAARNGTGIAPVPGPRTSGGFPRVDPETQRGRDDVRRRVLQDELTAEEKLLAQSRAEYAEGAPPALPEERSSPDRYRERIARLRQAVTLHERNVEALKKEIAGLR